MSGFISCLLPKKCFPYIKFSTVNIAKQLSSQHSRYSTSVKHVEGYSKEKSVIKNFIIQKIKISGPMTIADYMKIALTSPISGFYMKQDVFGIKGHFTTSPEISQIFGELIGIWIINEWQRFGQNIPLRIVELGPGRGTLTLDISRVLSQLPATQNCSSLDLVEISPFLKQVQEQTLCSHISLEERDSHDSLTTTGIPITWYDTLDSVPNTPGFTAFIAHEFLDALPIHKFQRNEKKEWCEVLIDISENNELRYVLSRGPTPAAKVYTSDDIHGDNLEVSPESGVIVNKIADRLNKNDSCFLICDYGSDYSIDTTKSRDTFRAFQDHTLWDPLHDPGLADLTADVDFGFMRKIAQEKALIFGPVQQQSFLKNMHIDVRLQKLLLNADENQKEVITTGVKMILNEMGDRFKFMSMFPKDSRKIFANNSPAGFE